MPHRIARVRVHHQLGFGRGAGGEIQQQRIARLRWRVGRELGRGAVRILKAVPTGRRLVCASCDARKGARHDIELGTIRPAHDHVPHIAHGNALAQVFGCQQRGGGNDDGTKLDAGEHHIPQCGYVAEHEQDAIPALHAQRAQVVGRTGGTLGHLRKRQACFVALIVVHPEGDGIVAAGHGVEIIERPVEAIQRGPCEIAHGGVVVLTVREQKIAAPQECIQRGHASLL